MSFFGFNIAGSALSAYQAAEDATSNNVANVSTPGASRQIAVLSPMQPIVGSPFLSANPANHQGMRGDGVIVSGIRRIHQDSYDALFRGASSSQSYYNVLQQQLQATQSALGEPANGINSAYINFRSSVQGLISNPSGTAERNNVLEAAGALVTTMNNAGQAIISQEAQVKQLAAQGVEEVNNLADQIAALNGQIRASRAIGDNPNTYLDQRDYLIDQLSNLLSTHTDLQASGSSLVTVDGKALINDTVVYHLAAPVIGTNANGTLALKIGFVNDPNPANPTPVRLGTGELGAYIDLYNTKLIPYRQKLDNFASTLVAETGRITQAAYDVNGTAGGQLFQPIVSTFPIGAGNIKLGMSDASQIPASLVSTLAGTLIQPLNAANNSVDTSASMLNNPTMANAPAAALVNTLTINVDGIAQTFNYDTGAGGNARTIDGFINSFNAGHFGVTSSFDANSQRIVFTRDPANIDLVHRAAQGANAPTPGFTITDNANATTTQSALGNPAVDLLDALGASQINGVQQNSTNAFGPTNAGGANALLAFFSNSYGVPALQTTSGSAATVPGSLTIPGPATTTFSAINPGDTLTIDAGNPGQENVVVTGVNRFTGTITFTAVNAHGANFSVATAQTQTLQNYYSASVAAMGVDVATATSGNNSQAALTSNIDKVRQGIDGINIDEETQNLIKFQNAYAAAAHTISVLNSLLGLAVNIGTATTF